MKRLWIIAASVFVLFAALFGAALHYGWIGHHSIHWREFRNQVERGEYKELRIYGKTIRVQSGGTETTVDAPSDVELKALIYSADQHGVKLVFEK